MGANRDKVVNLLPWSLIEEIERQHRDIFAEARRGGVLDLVSACYKKPRNVTEAKAHQDIIEKGYVPLNRGWPDFFAFGPKGDVFCVEVKSDTDELHPAQRVIHHFLAERGIDVYVRWGSGDNPIWERVGSSQRWVNRFEP